MAIPYPDVGAFFYGQFNPTSITAICNSLKTFLMNCGWISDDLFAHGRITFTQPADTSSITIDGITFTFKTTPTLAHDVQIGASAANTVSNLVVAVNSFCTNCTSTASGAVLILTGNVGGPAGSDISVSGNAGGAATFSDGFNSGFAAGKGYKLTMPPTPDGLDAAVWIDDPGSGGTFARIRCGTVDESLMSAANSATASNSGGIVAITVALGRTLEFCGCAHQFLTFIANDSSTGGCQCFFTVPKMRDAHVPTTITDASNTTPIVIESIGHGLTTGVDLFLSGIQGNTAANGFHTITVIDANHYSLDGSVGNGAYVSGSGLVASGSQISRCFLLYGDDSNHNDSWRITFSIGSQLGARYFVAVNQYFYTGSTSSINGPGFKIPKHALANTIVLNWGLWADLLEAKLCWPIASTAGTIMEVGTLWGAFIVEEAIPMDRTRDNFDGHNWFNFTDGSKESRGSLWFAKSTV